MDIIISFIKEQLKRSRTKQLLGIGLILLVLAILIGIADNPPGIVLSYTGVCFITVAFVHHWREASAYGTLLAISVVSFPVFVLLHNIFEILMEKIGAVPVLDQLLLGFSVIFFLAAVFISPAGIAIGAILGLYYLIRSK